MPYYLRIIKLINVIQRNVVTKNLENKKVDEHEILRFALDDKIY